MKILAIDDHQLFLDGIHFILKKMDADVEIFEVNDAATALQHITSSNEFDLILLDLHIPGNDEVYLLDKIQKIDQYLPLVIISAEDDPRMIKSVLESGVLGFIPKYSTSQQMIKALQLIISGDIYVPDEIRRQIENIEAAETVNEADIISQKLETLGVTRSQYEVLLQIANGLSNKQIARRFSRTEHTIKAHASALFKVLNATNRTDCVYIAQRQGLIPMVTDRRNKS